MAKGCQGRTGVSDKPSLPELPTSTLAGRACRGRQASWVDESGRRQALSAGPTLPLTLSMQGAAMLGDVLPGMRICKGCGPARDNFQFVCFLAMRQCPSV